MTKEYPGRTMRIVMLVATSFVASAAAQEASKVAETHLPAETEQTCGGQMKLPEAEFVGSPSFRSASLVQPLWTDLTADGHYFGGDENNVG